MATIRELITRWTLKTDTKPLSKLDKSLHGVKRAAAVTSRVIAVAFGATAAAGTAVFAAAEKMAEGMDKTLKSSQRIGVSTDMLQQLKHAADLGGVEFEKLSVSMKTLVKNASEAKNGNKAYQDSFRRLGVSVKDAKGKIKGGDAIVREVLGALADMPATADRTRIAMQLMSEGGADLMTMLDGGRFAFASNMAEAKKLGMVLSKDALQGASDFNDSMTRLKGGLMGAVSQGFSSVIPEINKLVSGAKLWVEQNKEIIAQNIGKVVTGIANAFVELSKRIDFGKIMGVLVRLFSLLGNLIALIVDHSAALSYVLGGLIAAKVLTGLYSLGKGLLSAFSALRSITNMGPSAVSALSGIAGKINVLTGAAASFGVGWQIGTYLDELTGASTKAANAVWNLLHSQEELDKRQNKRRSVKVGAGDAAKRLWEQANMYSGMMERGISSISVEGGKRMALNQETVMARLQSLATQLGMGSKDFAAQAPILAKMAGFAPGNMPGAAPPVAGSTNANIQSHVTVNVPPGTDASMSQRTGDATSKAMTGAYRQAMADATR